MKRIFIVRHAQPLRHEGEPDCLWPLTAQGHLQAEYLRKMEAERVYASPCRRALETAQHAGLPVQTDARLQERIPGEDAPDLGDCWLRQYQEPDFKCPGGESFAEVGQRMSACIDDVLAAMEDKSAVLVISHAAAICAFLMRHCSIRVTDRASKTREIIWQNGVIYAGMLSYLSGFCLSYDQGRLVSLEALHAERSDDHGD